MSSPQSSIRLLNTHTGEFEEVNDSSASQFATLSYVRAKPDSHQHSEQTYQDLVHLRRKHGIYVISHLSEMVKNFLIVARNDGFVFGWVDWCCINKKDSSELSRSISSMFRWYKGAAMCYVYMHDVQTPNQINEGVWQSEFRASVYFTRGWTLQELVAPRNVVFLSKDWKAIGSRDSLAPLVEEITGIERAVLTCAKPLESVPVARRIAWAANRITTLVEDEAYSLMGILGTNMETRYGEERGAFRRLQKEVLQRHRDLTIFAWGYFPDCADAKQCSTYPQTSSDPSHGPYPFASSPSDFKACSGLVRLSRDGFARKIGFLPDSPHDEVAPTDSRGMHMARVPLVAVHLPNSAMPIHLALLPCEDSSRGLLALLLRRQGNTNCYSVGTYVKPDSNRAGSIEPRVWSNATFVSEQMLVALRPSLRMSTVCISTDSV